MKTSSFSWVLGIGVVFGLFGTGLWCSAAYADDRAPGEPSSKEPTLDFTFVKAPHHPELQFERAKVPGGWIMMVRGLNSKQVEGFTFYPDPKHVWDAVNMEEKAEEAEETVLHKEVGRMPQRIFPPKYKPAEAAAKAMELYDADKDGKISGDELEKAPGLKAALKVMKTDKEKGVTADQIKERIQKWLDSRIGRTSLSCMVTHNGQPLAGATVKFVPEKFLSKYSPDTATGVTNQTGMAMLSVPTGNDLPPGLPPGIYRVEITKNGEDIPAKYNTETVLGQEVSLDNIDMQMGIKFNLKY
jgi:hypothetical protein